MNKNICFFLLCVNTSLYAENIQSLDLLRNKIESHIISELPNYSEGKLKVTADKLDSRLNLKACADNKLEIFNPYNSPLLTASTMGIKCLEPENHWTLYVPVKISILKTILVAKNALIKGQRISSNDFYAMEMDTQKLKQGYFTNAQELIGLVCQKNIAPDSPLNSYNVELPKLVRRGEHIAITTGNDNLSISMDGIALDEGANGDKVRVKNLSSKRVIEAQVVGTKKVKVAL